MCSTPRFFATRASAEYEKEVRRQAVATGEMLWPFLYRDWEKAESADGSVAERMMEC